MRALLWEPFTVPFMARALAALSILAVAGAAVSVFVLLRRLAFAADTLTHTVFPGVVLGYLVAGEAGVLWGALGAAVATALALTLLTQLARVSDDAAMAILLTAMFSIGVVLVSRRASYTADLTAFLFGRVLTVTAEQILQTAIVAGIALLALAATAKEQVLRAFDPVGARAAGYRIVWLDLVLNLVVALVVVAAVRAVGVLLVIALLVVPAAAGRLVTARLWLLGTAGCVVALLAAYAGLLVSYHASVSYGVRLAAAPTVVLALTLGYVLLAGAARLLRLARPGATAGAPIAPPAVLAAGSRCGSGGVA
jgi:ABC-type Mn2+/Zn2+ transport system permease subunit